MLHVAIIINVILFLSEIDYYRYMKHCVIPLCHYWLNSDDDNMLQKSLPPMTIPRATQIVGRFIVSFDGLEPNHIRSFYPAELGKLGNIELSIVDEVFSLKFGDIPDRIRKGEIVVNVELLDRYYYDIWGRKPRKTVEITFEQLLQEGFMTDELTNLAIKLEQLVYETYKSAYSRVQEEESLAESNTFPF